MVEPTLFDLLEQHPVLCATPFCQWAALGRAPYTPSQQTRLRNALRELLGQLTTMQRAANGGHYQGLAQILLRADINARALLGRQSAAAYAWLTIHWRQPQPPAEVVQAWKSGLSQLIGWVRHHTRELPITQAHPRLQQAA